MSTNTANYNLVKPSGAPGGDLVDIAVIDSNMDIIDTQIKNRSNEVVALQTRATALERSTKTLDYQTATVTVASGNAGPKALTGMSRVIAIAATTDVVFMTIELDWSGAAGSTIATLGPQVDGAGAGSGFTFNVVGGRFPFSKTWRITGLAVGNHTFSANIQWSAGSSLDIVGVSNTSCMILEYRPLPF